MIQIVKSIGKGSVTDLDQLLQNVHHVRVVVQGLIVVDTLGHVVPVQSSPSAPHLLEDALEDSCLGGDGRPSREDIELSFGEEGRIVVRQLHFLGRYPIHVVDQGLDLSIDDFSVCGGAFANQWFNDNANSCSDPGRQHSFHSCCDGRLQFLVGQDAVLIEGAALGGQDDQDLIFYQGLQDSPGVISHRFVEAGEGGKRVRGAEVKEVGNLEVASKRVEITSEGSQVIVGNALLVLVDPDEGVGDPYQVQSRPVDPCVREISHDMVIIEAVLVETHLLEASQHHGQSNQDDRDDGDDDPPLVFFLHRIQIRTVLIGFLQGYNLKSENMDSDSERLETVSDEYDSEREDNLNDVIFEESFKQQKKEKKYQEMTFLLGCLKNHFIFYNLSEAEIENVAKKMFYCSVPSDTFVFTETSKAMCFFIIEKGMMQIISNDKIKKTLRVGDGFGQIALLYKSPRAFSVKACEHCSLWAIDRNTFRKAVQEIIIQEYEENKKFMENVRFFSSLSNDHKDTIAGALITQQYVKGQVIVNEGDPGSSFYIIKEGTAAVYKGNKLMTKLQKTDSFGEQALFYNTVRQMTVKAEEDMTCLILGRQTLSKVLGDQIFVVTFRNFMKWAIQKSTHLSKLSKEQIEKILDLMKINSYKAGNVVIKKNTQNVNNQKIIIVIEGALKKYKNINPIAVRSQIYGEEFLLQNKTKARYEDDIVMESDGVIAEIKTDIVKEIIGGFMDTVVEENEKKQAEKFHEQIKKRNKLIDGLDQLVLLQELKEGEFGPILLVGCLNQLEKQKLYVLKCYSKQKIEEHSLFKYISQEKNLLKSLYHPFIMEYYKSFKDEHYLYSLVEFIQGEELYYGIREIGLLSTEDTQFYIASMILILEYLTTQGVIMRDLKPENFMVDVQGFLKLIDLVAAKVVKGRNIMSAKTFTLIGTPHYMAPEIIIGKGYTFTVSLYSLGINMFEFMCGYVPFGEKSEDPLEIYEQILNLELKYPRSLKDKKARKLMEQLLNKNEPEGRLGGPTFMSLKNNPWFQSISWEDLYERKIETPKFDRNLNIQGTEFEIERGIRHAKNCVDYLDEKLPLRNVGENKVFTNW